MELKDKVMLALDEIRPFLAADGGDISLIDIKEETPAMPPMGGGGGMPGMM